MSLTQFSEAKASRKTALRDTNVTSTPCSCSKGGSLSPSRTIARSHGGTRDLEIGRSHKIELKARRKDDQALERDASIARTPIFKHSPLPKDRVEDARALCVVKIMCSENPSADKFSRSGAKPTAAGVLAVDERQTLRPAIASADGHGWARSS